MSPPEHEQTVATKRTHAPQRTPDQEAHWDADPSSKALAHLRQTTGNAGLLHLLARHQPSVQRDEQDGAVREAGRKERAARREALAARRESLEARKQARAARLAGGPAPAAPQGPVAPAGPQAAAGPVPAAAAPAAAGPAQAPTAAEIMAAKLAKFAELQNKRQADITASTPRAGLGPAAPAAAVPAPKARIEPNHGMAAQQLGELNGRLEKVGEPVTRQRIYNKAGDKATLLLYREKNQLSEELGGIVREYRAGRTTDAQFQSEREAWLAKLSAYEQKVKAYKPPPATYVPQGRGQTAADIEDDTAAKVRREGRWADRWARQGR